MVYVGVSIGYDIHFQSTQGEEGTLCENVPLTTRQVSAESVVPSNPGKPLLIGVLERSSLLPATFMALPTCFAGLSFKGYSITRLIYWWSVGKTGI